MVVTHGWLCIQFTFLVLIYGNVDTKAMDDSNARIVWEHCKNMYKDLRNVTFDSCNQLSGDTTALEDPNSLLPYIECGILDVFIFSCQNNISEVYDYLVKPQHGDVSAVCPFESSILHNADLENAFKVLNSYLSDNSSCHESCSWFHNKIKPKCVVLSKVRQLVSNYVAKSKHQAIEKSNRVAKLPVAHGIKKTSGKSEESTGMDSKQNVPKENEISKPTAENNMKTIEKIIEPSAQMSVPKVASAETAVKNIGLPKQTTSAQKVTTPAAFEANSENEIVEPPKAESVSAKSDVTKPVGLSEGQDGNAGSDVGGEFDMNGQPPPPQEEENPDKKMDSQAPNESYGDDDDNDDVDPVENTNHVPQNPGTKQVKEEGSSVSTGFVLDGFIESEDSHFFIYFLMTMSIFIFAYIVFHNKNKVLAYALEGKRKGRRRPNTANYRKLDSNLEEAISSTSAHESASNIVY